MSASGTFGAGLEGRAFADLSGLGALVSKTVTVVPWHGNPPQRIVETPAGMLNSIGLENRGADYFLRETLPAMRAIGPPVIVNIGGESVDDFVALAERFSAAGVDALEVNLSCPNVQGGRLLFSTDPKMTEVAMRRVKEAATVPVFAKLSPNVTDITEIARAAEAGGADGITAINTLIGMAVDWRRGRAVLGRTIGGLSGPAIRPVALRMVHQVRQAVRLPILGCGGIASAEDALQFLAAGADAVQVGTASFVDPARMTRIVDDMRHLLEDAGTTVRQLIGAVSATGRTPGREAPQP
ncbi:MAG: dihydroorotate dehydrogenase [Planctomycetes bacterium]|nr:dihydroorotate dehydrogenase [Planctomycetota bacterium]MCB9889639.1 dihydroorotate dehydrogenase [Planctomycetota bacterium]